MGFYYFPLLPWQRCFFQNNERYVYILMNIIIVSDFMIVLNREPMINKVPDYKGEQYGKIQISSKELAKYVGTKVDITIYIYEHTEKHVLNTQIIAG